MSINKTEANTPWLMAAKDLHTKALHAVAVLEKFPDGNLTRDEMKELVAAALAVTTARMIR